MFSGFALAGLASVTLVMSAACGADSEVEWWCGNYEEQMSMLVDRARVYNADPSLFHKTLPITRQGLMDLRDTAPNDRLGHALDGTLSDWALLNFDPGGIANVLGYVGMNGDPVVIACDQQGVEIG